MPSVLHDPAVRDSVRSRVESLTPQSPRKWGKMTVDQMLWHCNEGLTTALGITRPAPLRMMLLKPFMKWGALNMPWPKGAPTHPDWRAGERHDFETVKRRALELIDQFTSRGIDAADWAPSPGFGEMSGAEWSQLQAKHWDHHLRQFGV
jgi:hypothetical protein